MRGPAFAVRIIVFGSMQHMRLTRSICYSYLAMLDDRKGCLGKGGVWRYAVIAEIRLKRLEPEHILDVGIWESSLWDLGLRVKSSGFWDPKP